MDVLIFVLVDQSKSGASANAISQAGFPRESGCLDALLGKTEQRSGARTSSTAALAQNMTSYPANC
jgi:hypothetical protein